MSKRAMIIIKKVQQGLYSAYWRGTNNPICKGDYVTPCGSFNSRKQAEQYIKDNEYIIN